MDSKLEVEEKSEMRARPFQAQFFRCLAAMFSSGIPLDRCFDSLAQQTPDALLREAAGQMNARICRGQMLSEAMETHPLFSKLQVQLVRVGESSGALEVIFGRIADEEERRLALEDRVRLALTTPLWVGCICLLCAIFLPPFLFHGLLAMFEDGKLTVPWPTRLLMEFSAFVRSPWLLMTTLSLGLALWAVRGRFQLWWSSLSWQSRLLRLPVIGRVLWLVALTRLLHSLEMMVSSGVPLIRALQLAGHCSASPPLGLAMQEAVRSIQGGADLGAALKPSGWFPNTFIQGLRAGQECGRLAGMLKHLSRLFEIELEHSLELLARASEPLFLLMVGGCVGFTVIATLMPMVDLIRSF
ncbi:type II secretion system F family protein [bacterium]|nr:type II secretion system F family protein [bacterium]